MTPLDDMRATLAAVIRAVSTTPPAPLPPAELAVVLTLLAALVRCLDDPVVGPRLVGLLAQVLADEEALTARERRLLPVVGT